MNDNKQLCRSEGLAEGWDKTVTMTTGPGFSEPDGDDDANGNVDARQPGCEGFPMPRKICLICRMSVSRKRSYRNMIKDA